MRKTSWLNKKIDLGALRRVKTLLKGLRLNTVCEEALCPNISECFSKGIATFMIMGSICTRNCRFCGVKKGKPLNIDPQEPKRIKEAIKALKLKYVVVTSPTRDDLYDGGSLFFAETVSVLKSLDFVEIIELLIPDFSLNIDSLNIIAHCGAGVIGHNVETVPSLYKEVRPMAGYKRSLEVLRIIKRINNSIITKSGIMLGLGENDDEVLRVFSDLRSVGCDFLSIGQYLPPSLEHYPVKEYVAPEKFTYFKEKALAMGFKSVLSAPYVRSSYLADSYFNNIDKQGRFPLRV